MQGRLGIVVVCSCVWLGCGGGGGTDGGPTIDGGADAGHDTGVDAPALCHADSDCDDGTFCNGAEHCLPSAGTADAHGCVAATSPCITGQTCNEATSHCDTECDVSADADGDGHAAPECGGDDCDDANAARYPTNAEVCDALNVDEDCDATTLGARDVDGDGVVSAACCNTNAMGVLHCGDDCDDLERTVSPSSPEVCDGLDNDCDGMVDDGVQVDGFVDADGDLHGDPTLPVRGCAGIARLSAVGDDCDDANPALHPAQPEVCNLVDDDCDGVADEGTAAVTWYRDADGDGFGSAAGGTRSSCVPPTGYSLLGTDCDDAAVAIHPGAAETCDGKDDDCNGSADFVVGRNDGEDDDHDGAPDVACAGPTAMPDCDDRDPAVYPGAPELVGDHVDNDCDLHTDDVCTMTSWYTDADGDGWGDTAATPVRACDPQAGHVSRDGDCDDADPARNPGQRERCNGVDDDCDGTVDDGSDLFCYAPHALGACTAGACSISLCELGRSDCDTTVGGCETSTDDDFSSCGTCGHVCDFGAHAVPVCARGACGIACGAGFADCNTMPTDGCEIDTTTDPVRCGSCTMRCPTRAHATPTCASSTCGLSCDAGYRDCDTMPTNGCEIHVDRDPANCGGCAMPCGPGEICVAGSCGAPAFPSTGSEGPLDVTADLVLSPGIHDYTTIHIAAGATVTTTGSGVLDLRASGDVSIDGVIDVSGGAGGGNGTGVSVGGGGATGNPRAPGGSFTLCSMALGGGGGTGGVGTAGSNAPTGCATGGNRGGGSGCAGACSGAGGGGYAGGGGGNDFLKRVGGPGASAAGGMGGLGGGDHGSGTCDAPAGGVGTGAYAGQSASCAPLDAAGGGGGGAIGADAASDLAVATTFRPGSGGGGSGGGAFSGGGGCGGGGGGGALRIASATSVHVSSSGALRANGGAGGDSGDGDSGAGGGSGGVIYVAAPALLIDGTIDAVGGIGGGAVTPALRGGTGGLGRVRFSTVPAECVVTGAISPGLVAGACSVTSPGVTERVYVAAYPN